MFCSTSMATYSLNNPLLSQLSAIRHVCIIHSLLYNLSPVGAGGPEELEPGGAA